MKAGRSPRLPHVCEIERARGFPNDFSDAISKEGKDIMPHQVRRAKLLAMAPPVWFALFTLQALLGESCKVPVHNVDYSAFFVDRATERVFLAAREASPYLDDRKRRGLSTDWLPPDEAELHANGADFLVDGLVTKREIGIRPPRRTVPVGLTQEDHFLEAIVSSNPLEDSAGVPDDLAFAARVCVEQGSAIDAWRAKQWTAFEEAVASLSVLGKRLDADRCPNSKHAAARVSLQAMALASFMVAWPDDVTGLMRDGAEPLGIQRDFGIYRARRRDALLSVDEFTASHARERPGNASPGPPPDDAVDTIWQETLQEQALGFVGPFASASDLDALHGAGNWTAMPRFAIRQKSKWRLIDDGARGGHNATFSARETIHTTSVSAAMSLARRFRSLRGKRVAGKWKLKASSCDMWKAYKQIPIAEAQRRHMHIKIYSPHERQWKFVESYVLAFGLAGSVLHFSRVHICLYK